MSRVRSSSFTGWPRELFAEELKKSDLRAANSGKSFPGEEEAVIVGKDGIEKQLPLDQGEKPAGLMTIADGNTLS